MHLLIRSNSVFFWLKDTLSRTSGKWNGINNGILELQGWTDGMDPDADWVMTALLVSCPQPRFHSVWPDFPWDICFRMFL